MTEKGFVPTVTIATRGKGNKRRCSPVCMLFQQTTGCRAGFQVHMMVPDPEKCPGNGVKRLIDANKYMDEALYDKLRTAAIESKGDSKAEGS